MTLMCCDADRDRRAPSLPARTIKELWRCSRPIPANSAIRRPAPARRRISPANCSGRVRRRHHPRAVQRRRPGDEFDHRRPYADRFSAISTAAPSMRARQLRGLAVMSEKRWTTCPMCRRWGSRAAAIRRPMCCRHLCRRRAEAGHRPSPPRDCKALALPTSRSARNLGLDPIGNSPDEFGAWIKAEVAKWAKVMPTPRSRCRSARPRPLADRDRLTATPRPRATAV